MVLGTFQNSQLCSRECEGERGGGECNSQTLSPILWFSDAAPVVLAQEKLEDRVAESAEG